VQVNKKRWLDERNNFCGTARAKKKADTARVES
jgi:hypothetical protein